MMDNATWLEIRRYWHTLDNAAATLQFGLEEIISGEDLKAHHAMMTVAMREVTAVLDEMLQLTRKHNVEREEVNANPQA